MSLNLNQIFVRYPDPKDAAELLLDVHTRKAPAQSFVVAQAGGGWLAVLGGDNTLAQDIAPLLSRALEAQALWFGLSGDSLAYRLLRWDLGREVERVMEPVELFTPDGPLILPVYKDVEAELHKRLLALKIPAAYLYLFAEEVGMSGGDAGTPDAATVRNGGIGPFRHRVPRRTDEGVRTLFDRFEEDDQRVIETLTLHGGYDEERAKRLFKTLDGLCRRRSLYPDWTVRFEVTCPKAPETAERVLALHAKAGYGYEMRLP